MNLSRYLTWRAHKRNNNVQPAPSPPAAGEGWGEEEKRIIPTTYRSRNPLLNSRTIKPSTLSPLCFPHRYKNCYNMIDMQRITTLPRLSRQEIETHTVDYYRTAGGTRPALRVVDMNEQRFVVKDFRRSDFLFRTIVGPILVRREFGALRNLIGVKGIPGLVGRLDRYAVAIQHVSGISLEHINPGTLNQDFYIELRKVIDDMHKRGVAHCDLRSRGNVMLGDDGQPYVVDFAACVYRGRGINPFTRWLFHQFVLADNNAVLRIKQRLSPELLSEAEKAELAVPHPFEIPARIIGENVRKLTRSLLTRKSHKQ